MGYADPLGVRETFQGVRNRPPFFTIYMVIYVKMSVGVTTNLIFLIVGNLQCLRAPVLDFQNNYLLFTTGKTILKPGLYTATFGCYRKVISGTQRCPTRADSGKFLQVL